MEYKAEHKMWQREFVFVNIYYEFYFYGMNK